MLGGSASTNLNGVIYPFPLFASDGSGYAVVRNFLGGTSDGADPSYAGVVEKNGVLYGLTSIGGTFDRGTLYAIRPDGTGYTILLNFGAGDADASVPNATLLRGSDGLLYGTSARGGGGGTIFRLRTN